LREDKDYYEQILNLPPFWESSYFFSKNV